MHLFLTGEIQVGKSTLLRKVLAGLGGPAGGFQTRWHGRGPGATLHLSPWGSDPVWDVESRAAIREAQGPPRVLPGAFDRLGPALLSPASAGGTVMDELGYLEGDAPRFQAAVLARLASTRPVLGVLKPRHTPFLDAVRGTPGVEVVAVTRENRDTLAPALIRALAPYW